MSLSPIHLFLQGGGFMWPILALSIVALTLIIERIVFFTQHKYNFKASLERLRNPPSETPTRNPLVRVGRTVIREADGGPEHVRNIAGREANQAVTTHERGLRLLGIIGMVAPLVGLLGTVWGMVLAFAKMAELGDKVTAGDFAGGIWTALLTTVGGLIVAIPTVAATRFFEGKVDRLAQDMNALGSHLSEWLFGPQSATPEDKP